MPYKKTNKTNKKKNNKKTQKNYKKKPFSKKEYKTIKSISQAVVSYPKNKEYSQVCSSFYINNCGILYQPSDLPTDWENTYEAFLGNYRFYPLTCLGSLEDALNNIPSKDLLNLKANNFIIRWVNNNTSAISSDVENDRIGLFNGLRLSIHSIQIKGFFDLNNYQGYALPSKVGFRIVRGYDQFYKDKFTTYADGVNRGSIPSINQVYKSMSHYTISTQDDLDKLQYSYVKDLTFNKRFKTVLKRYVYFNKSDVQVSHIRKSFNILRRFKKPLELIYDEGSNADTTESTKYYLSKINNLFLCPYFSNIDMKSTPGTNIKYPTTKYKFSTDGTYSITAQIIINYSDS